MLWMKIVGCILVITSSTAIGFFFSNEMKYRLDNLRELRKLIVLLRGDIRFANTALPEAISAIARRNPGIYKTFFQNTAGKLQELSGRTFTEIWKEGVEIDLKDTSLSKKDKENLIGFGDNLGYLDKDMQLNTLELYITNLEEEITEISQKVKEKSYLYNSLGIMAGIFISILMF